MSKDDEYEYQQWYQKLNRCFEHHLNISADDFEDYSWRDAFDDGATPLEALHWFMEDNDYNQILT